MKHIALMFVVVLTACQQGPQGFMGEPGESGQDGAQGPAGPALLLDTVTVWKGPLKGTTERVNVECPSGDLLLGGGCQTNNTGLVTDTYPSPEHDAWLCGSRSLVIDGNGDAAEHELTAYAVCGRVSHGG